MKKRKILVAFILIAIYISISLIFSNRSYALEQIITKYINSIDSNKYPQIKETLQSLKNEHPNWTFKILYTDIDWNDAIANEYTGHETKPKNLIPANNPKYSGKWICSVCRNRTYDSGNWYCSSEAGIAYMMDPRNSTNNSDIFQFMELTYNGFNINALYSMIEGTFLNTDGNVNAILSACRRYNVNIYYAIARMLQEQGKDGTVLTSGQGYNGSYVGYYNVFNIGASGSGKEQVILNGLRRAETQGWDTIEKSIEGGIEIISASYIAKGQNTLYFQKFDVENSDGELFWHQYMQNILAAQSEGSTLRKTFQNVGSIDGEYTFIIPLYYNMPVNASERPSTDGIDIPASSDIVRVNVDRTLKLRGEPAGSSIVGTLYKDEIITRLEKATEKDGGTYWDYVMKADGTKGYAARETYDYEEKYKLYLVPVEEQPEPEPDIPDDSTIVKNDKMKIDTATNEMTVIPGVTGQDVEAFMGSEIIIKNSKGEELDKTAPISTGSVINNLYTVSVLGDVNGDGEINSGDLFATQKYLLKKQEFEEATKRACDVNKDGEINSGDLFFIQKYLLKKTDFTI